MGRYQGECVEPNGVIYYSEAAMARAYGVKPATFSRRKLCGYSLEKCLMPYKNPYNNGKSYFTYNGAHYKSLRDCCVSLGISYSAVVNRIEHDKCTAEEAINHYL